MPGRYQQIDMAKHAATGFIEDKVTQRLIFGDPFPLLPNRVTGWWRNAANYDVANLTLGMA